MTDSVFNQLRNANKISSARRIPVLEKIVGPEAVEFAAKVLTNSQDRMESYNQPKKKPSM